MNNNFYLIILRFLSKKKFQVLKISIYIIFLIRIYSILIKIYYFKLIFYFTSIKKLYDLGKKIIFNFH